MVDGLEALKASGTFNLRRINFVLARNRDAHSQAAGTADLIPLNDPVQPRTAMSPGMVVERKASSAAAGPSGRAGGAHKRDANGRRRELFAEEDVLMSWASVRRMGPGLANLGNTCFMNSVLQCLTYTAPLAQCLESLNGSLIGRSGDGFDPLRITQEHVVSALNARTRVMAPRGHAKSLRKVNKSFRLGRQEDAHEYLIALLDSMHESLISHIRPKPSPELEQTSMIYRIFGGKMRSQVKCCSCGYESNTYDPLLDVSLEITRSPSVGRALERFTAGETLDGDNRYKCPRQNKLVRAVKRMSFEAAPKVLVLQLKRFEFSMFGHKISRKVDFDTVLDLSPYMSQPGVGEHVYELYAVLVHSGHSVHSGHYFCFVRAANGIWYRMDDTTVQQVGERTVMEQRAYMLFYSRRTPPRKQQQQLKKAASDATPVAARKAEAVKAAAKPTAAAASDTAAADVPAAKARKMAAGTTAAEAARTAKHKDPAAPVAAVAAGSAATVAAGAANGGEQVAGARRSAKAVAAKVELASQGTGARGRRAGNSGGAGSSSSSDNSSDSMDKAVGDVQVGGSSGGTSSSSDGGGGSVGGFVDQLATRLTNLVPDQLLGSRRWMRMCANLKSNMRLLIGHGGGGEGGSGGGTSFRRLVRLDAGAPDSSPSPHPTALQPLRLRNGRVVRGPTPATAATARRTDSGSSSGGRDSGGGSGRSDGSSRSVESSPPVSAASWPPLRSSPPADEQRTDGNSSGGSSDSGGDAATTTASEAEAAAVHKTHKPATRGGKAPTATASAPADARRWLASGAGEGGVQAWDGGASTSGAVGTTSGGPSGGPGKRKGGYRYDEWDAEYDTGKQKKVRVRDEEDGGTLLDGEGNRFQEQLSRPRQQHRDGDRAGGGRGRGRGGRGRGGRMGGRGGGRGGRGGGRSPSGRGGGGRGRGRGSGRGRGR